LPTKAEWEQLISNAHEKGKLEAGIVLKDSVGWEQADDIGNNATGFSALPAGYMMTDTNPTNEGKNAFFWSVTISEDEGFPYYMVLGYNSKQAIVFDSLNPSYKMSIRCLKD
jgi:uncharacterized protein (TIGR02145 family)